MTRTYLVGASACCLAIFIFAGCGMPVELDLETDSTPIVADGGSGDSGDLADQGYTPDAGDETDAGPKECQEGNDPCNAGNGCCAGLICPKDTCQKSICGDGYPDPARLEECDDENPVSGDGCENNCKFTCLSTDSGRNCKSANPCEEDGVCDDTVTHTCAKGSPKSDGAACDTGKICVSGACQPSTCGDGIIDKGANEECDFGPGANIAGSGCEPGCKLSCQTTPADTCPDGNVCNGTERCDIVDFSGHAGQKCIPGTPLQNGTLCGSGGFCTDGKCNESICGDGYTDDSKGEECDDKNLVSGDGCEPVTCKFSCSNPAADCSAPPVCKKSDCNDKHVCIVVADPSQNGDVCGNGLACNNGNCEAPPQVCGNGKVESPEECDDGNETTSDGCEPITCKYSCHNAANDCPPAPVCNAPVCADVLGDGGKLGQKCATAPANEGLSVPGCAAPNTCKGGNCTPPTSQCGNSVPEPGEQCDFGKDKNLPGSGCEPNCTFSCAKTPTDTCNDGNPCNGIEACTTVTVDGRTGQKCFPGTALGDGTSCGTGNICLGGQCKASTCGDGYVDKSREEQCDYGPGLNVAGSGCEPGCKFSCQTAPADTCPDGNDCNGVEKCSTVTVNGHTGMKCAPGMPVGNGTVCGTGGFCTDGKCNPSICGDGYTDGSKGEECDDRNSVPGDGCEPVTCKFTCLATDPTRNCASANPCVNDGACGANHVCIAGSQKTNCTSCGTGNLCISGQCKASTCGDTCTDSGKGEQCEPPNSGTCDSNCKKIACGDNQLAGPEVCDDNDGTPNNLDGCDTACMYEMMFRMTSVSISSSAAPSACTPSANAFGTKVLTGMAVSQLNTSLKEEVDAGNTNVIVQLLGLEDLTGTNDPSMELGIMSAVLDPAKGAWPGNNPMDWWFLAAAINLDSNDIPLSRLSPSSISSKQIGAGPSDVNMSLLLGGSAANLKMRGARLYATVDGSPNTPPAPPPALLKSGASVMTTITGATSGKGLCGNITVESLAKIPVPEVLTTSGSAACVASSLLCKNTRTYTYCGSGQPVGPNCNSLLDVIVGGCKATILCVAAVNPTQPDVADSASPYQGSLTLGSGNKVPDNQTVGNNRGYSAFLNFTANRAHVTGKQ